MTFKYNDVYINEVSTITGPYEKNGPISKYYDKSYDDFYMGMNSWEKAESKMLEESVNLLLKKINKKNKDIDIMLSGDLLNQIVATNYAARELSIPLAGIYGACSTSCLGITLASCLVDSKQIKNAIVSVSSHNNASEKQYRQPVEYGGPKRKTATFTVTGGASCYLSNSKSNIKVESGTIGKVIDLGVSDALNMGAIMAPAAADTIYNHLKDTNRTVDYYDLILTGDLGRYGKDILKDYMKEEYNITLNNHDDAACMIYDLENQPVYAGGSGPACLPLVTYGYIFNKMKEGKYNKVLLVATGALLSPTMAFEKFGIPAIAHAVSLEVIK